MWYKISILHLHRYPIAILEYYIAISQYCIYIDIPNKDRNLQISSSQNITQLFIYYSKYSKTREGKNE